ncbi:MAG: biotin--[acetyl-CoA-carboxylase] ligase [Clostridia bacterium]|nr:biotin--[acetyl-CoA-carboxylase] ligase [Clostridia bacterium]
MDIASLKKLLAGCTPAELLIYFEQTSSTNDDLKQLAGQGAPAGTAVIAKQQQGGRGRLGRSFSSPAGGLYLSVLLRPKVPARELLHLTALAAVACCDAVEEVCGLRPGIKWTNDLVVGKKKLGGILTELSVDAKTGKTAYAIIGVGINCKTVPPEVAELATSLEKETEKPVSPEALAAAVIKSLGRMQGTMFAEKSAWLARYAADCITVGQEVSVVCGDSVRHATADAIGENGELLVTYDNGEKGIVSSGEVSVRGMYGYI